MSAPTRPCLTCGGAGYDPTVADGCSAPYLHDTYCICHESPCPVCLGSGQVEAKPSVRDALVDAETIWRVLTCDRLFKSARFKRMDLTEADDFGSQCYSEINREHIKESRLLAALAARAAFRAVPGLKGE